MLLTEISPGSTVELTAIIGSQKLEFTTVTLPVTEADKQLNKIIKKVGGGLPAILVDAISKDGKVVGFPAKGVVYQLVVVDKETTKAYKWPNIFIRLFKLPDGPPFHLMFSNVNAKEFNRRERFRLWLGCDATVQVGLNRMVLDCTVKDISSTGVAFILRNNLLEEKSKTLVPQDLVVLTFFDEKSGTNFRLTSIIVRVMAVDEQRTLYGCRFDEENHIIAQFVSQRQNEQLREQRKRT